jgi:hypothetical protein
MKHSLLIGSSFSAFPDESTYSTSSARLNITVRFVKDNEEGEDFLKVITFTATALVLDSCSAVINAVSCSQIGIS